jgi:hypothetical protein
LLEQIDQPLTPHIGAFANPYDTPKAHDYSRISQVHYLLEAVTDDEDRDAIVT